MSIDGRELAVACARAADETKAEEIRVLDVRGLSTLTDFLVICSGNSMPHLKAILRDVSKIIREKTELAPLHTEGKANSRWVVLDYVDVMVHVLDEESREMYALEDLWGDAKEVSWNDED